MKQSKTLLGALDANKRIEIGVNIIVFLTIYGLLVYYFKTNLIFSLTTTSGGDTGSHHYIPYYLKNFLLPKGQISGWAPGWYAGFPLLQFYFPLPYILMAFLSYLIPSQVAFKLVTILGIFLLPLTTFFGVKIMKFDFPMPTLAAIFALPFLFLESYSIYGGNILSTLAGEFSYSVSFSLSILFLGLVYRGIKSRKYVLTNAVVLAVTALNHLLPVVMIILSMFFFITNKFVKNFKYLAKVFALGFFLTAFWSFPFLAKLNYSTPMRWGQLKGLGILFPGQLWIFFILAGLGITFALLRRDEKTSFFLWILAVPFALFFILPDGPLWNARFVPYFYFFVLLLAAYGVFQSRQVFSFAAYRILGLPQRYSDYILPLVAIFLIAISTLATAVNVPGWIQWNYSGYETKPSWGTLKSLNNYLRDLPDGRVMWEYSATHNKFGTPRVLELIPFFAKKPTMEGLLIESALSAPFHFYNQAEVSKEATHAVQGVKYPTFDFQMGIRHLKLFNIKYFVATTPQSTEAADNHPDLKLLRKIEEFSVYRLKSDGYVVVPKNLPQIVNSSEWLDVSIKWYENKRMLDAPLVFVQGDKKKLPDWPEVSPALINFKKIPLENDTTITETVKNDEIVFRTSAVGKPHWIKMSYFPNWKVEAPTAPTWLLPPL